MHNLGQLKEHYMSSKHLDGKSITENQNQLETACPSNGCETRNRNTKRKKQVYNNSNEISLEIHLMGLKPILILLLNFTKRRIPFLQ